MEAASVPVQRAPKLAKKKRQVKEKSNVEATRRKGYINRHPFLLSAPHLHRFSLW
jgi:hypothetical protein